MLAATQEVNLPSAVSLARGYRYPQVQQLTWDGTYLGDLPDGGEWSDTFIRGATDEVRANLAGWDPVRPSARAIGAAELVAHLKGELELEDAVQRAKIATRQYAKRQRSWFRSRMSAWQWHPCH